MNPHSVMASPVETSSLDRGEAPSLDVIYRRVDTRRRVRRLVDERRLPVLRAQLDAMRQRMPDLPRVERAA